MSDTQEKQLELARLMHLVHAHADASAVALTETLYGSSESYTKLCNDRTEAARQALLQALEEALGIPGEAAGANRPQEPVWPAARSVGRQEDMGQGHLRLSLDSENDVGVAVYSGAGARSASIEFCTPGQGGGRSRRTRLALISLMLAIEADNADTPSLAWPPA